MGEAVVIDIDSYVQDCSIRQSRGGCGNESGKGEEFKAIIDICTQIEAQGSTVSLYFPEFCKEIEKLQKLLTQKNKPKGNTETNQVFRVNIVVGPQWLFFELGSHSFAGHEVAVYSNNPNFFHKQFVDMFQLKCGSNKNISIKQKRMEKLLEDLELMKSLTESTDTEESKTDPKLMKHNKEKIYQIKLKEGNKSIETGISDSETVVGPSTTTGSTVCSEIDKEMEELERKFNLDKNYKNSLAVLLEKIPKYFNKTDENNVLKFMNGLENLVNQHLNKFQKSSKIDLCTSERKNYFLFVRNFLYKNKIIECEILNLWVNTHHGDTEEKIKDSYTVKVDFDKIDKVLAELKETKSKFSFKGYQLVDKINNYGSICHAAVKNLIINDLMSSDKPISSIKSLTQNIHHVLKCIYNSKTVTKEQKYVIKKDKRVKYLICEILRNRGVWEEKVDGSAEINKARCEALFHELETYPSKKMINKLICEIQSIVCNS
ncbi:unnamed protein product [Moneuplotes crassus]|uniref:Uncharacterized protein n=2 Tax=Euplotes crassus TaxID=5936 RepID=A0AAD2D6W7_EUPCR|nr:unnamed protein product [Moneuplotes crassus]